MVAPGTFPHPPCDICPCARDPIRGIIVEAETVSQKASIGPKPELCSRDSSLKLFEIKIMPVTD